MIMQFVDKCVDLLFDKVIKVNEIEMLKNSDIDITAPVNVSTIYIHSSPNNSPKNINLYPIESIDNTNSIIKSSLFKLKTSKYSNPKARPTEKFNSNFTGNDSSVLEINELVSILSDDNNNKNDFIKDEENGFKKYIGIRPSIDSNSDWRENTENENYNFFAPDNEDEIETEGHIIESPKFLNRNLNINNHKKSNRNFKGQAIKKKANNILLINYSKKKNQNNDVIQNKLKVRIDHNSLDAYDSEFPKKRIYGLDRLIDEVRLTSLKDDENKKNKILKPNTAVDTEKTKINDSFNINNSSSFSNNITEKQIEKIDSIDNNSFRNNFKSSKSEERINSFKNNYKKSLKFVLSNKSNDILKKHDFFKSLTSQIYYKDD